jgi:uncharacterized protein (TIGR03083 family)
VSKVSYEMIEAERLAFADVLESLGPDDWARPSLCAGWTVRDVAAHIVSGAKSTPGAFVGGLISSGFNFDKMIAKNIAKEAGKDGPTLAKELRSVAALRTKPEKAMLGEIIVHSEDIHRALGSPGEHPAPNVIATLDHYRKAGAPLRSKQRASGLRLRATDLEWSAGDGPEVTGPALALLLAIAGRVSVVAELSGDGLATLRTRI